MGTSTPSPRTLRTISGTAAAASSELTVTRSSCEPAWARRATWIAVPSASAVSVLVIDWTATGWAEPTRTPPTSTLTVGRRRGRRASGELIERSGAPAQPARDVERRDPDQEREQEHESDHVGELLGPHAKPGSEEPLERDHQHPAAIERREGQDVDHRQVGRQHAGDVQREQRSELPEDVADPSGDARPALDRRRLRGAVDDRFRRGAQPAAGQ